MNLFHTPVRCIERVHRKMIAYRSTLLAVILIVCLNRYLLTDVEANCCSCLEALLQPDDRNKIVLSSSVMSGEYKRIDERLLSEAFELIDVHLRRSIDTGDFGSNIQELRVLIRNELAEKSEAEFAERKSWWYRWRRPQCLSQQLPSKSRVIMINALIRLLQLEHIDQTAHRCSILVTEELAECNRIAKDSIGRRNRKDPPLLPRIDDIIFDAALRRADICIPFYRDRLRAISKSADAFALVHAYWSQILEHRFNVAHFGIKHGKVDEIFKQHPRAALNLVEKMPYVIEKDEVEIAEKFLEAESRRRPFNGRSWDKVKTMQYEVYIETPCWDFMGQVKHTFDSLDFDLQMEQFLAAGLMEATLVDGEINRVKAYYMMCTKLLNQRSRFIQLINTYG